MERTATGLIAALEAQRAILGDTVDTAVAAMRRQLEELRARPSPDQASAAAAGERKQVTVLFADVSGFTAMSETMDPEDVKGVMDELWRRMDGVIHGHGGRVDKHIGDSMMVVYGAPVSHDDDVHSGPWSPRRICSKPVD